MFGSKNKRQKAEKEQRLGVALITYYEPKSIVAEQYRALRTNIEFVQVGQTGRNVLVVDADLRKPTVHRSFKLNNEQGLTTLLANPEMKFNQVVQKSKELNLYFLPSGPKPPNPAELIGLPQMAGLMEELSANFDMIIYDTSPVNSVTDAQIIATRVDGVLMVVRQGFAKKDQVREAKQALENVKANILGFVINNVPFEEGKGYGYYAYGLEDDE